MTIIHDLAETSKTTKERRQRDHARTYQPDPVLERLHGLGPKADSGNLVARDELAAMGPSERMALGYYSTSRAAAVALGLANATDGSLTGAVLR